MHQVDIAAGFIKENMPYKTANKLSHQDAWDVAHYINSQERPQDPRLKVHGGKTKEKFHQHDCRYHPF